MVKQVLEFLRPASLKIYCDLTIGTGGHAERILDESSPGGKLVGVDRDAQVLKVARKRLSKFSAERFELVHSTFSRIGKEVMNRHISGFDGILADFGVSSYQLDDPERGFSFMSEGPLDMRMDPKQGLTASDIVNRYSANRLSDILKEYGDERYARRIAAAIREQSRKSNITTTTQLARIVRSAVRRTRSGRIDAATRTFQALRIAVNDELNEISGLMENIFDLLNPAGVLVCISYHSHEDRIVKRAIARARKNNLVKILTSKPVLPQREEVEVNRRARSARLRAAVKLESDGG